MTIENQTMRKANVVSKQPSQNKTFVVDDASQPRPEMKMETPPTPDIVKNRVEQPVQQTRGILENLVFLGRTTEDISVGDYVFTLRTLTHQEMCDIDHRVEQEGGDTVTLNTYTLALSMEAINGTSIDDLSSENFPSSPFEKRLAIVSTMQRSIVSYLYDKYTQMLIRVNDSIDGDQIKN
jgi:hypothetical protein